MDRQRFSAIAHSRHRICCPVSEARARHLIDILSIQDSASVVDFGCGKAEWLRLIADRHNIQGIGLDSNPLLLEEASDTCAAYPGLSIQGGDASRFEPEMKIDLALCIGSTGIFGGFERTLSGLRPRLADGGLLLIGEGHWKQHPDPRYLEATGIPIDEMGTYAEVVGKAAALGYQELYSFASSEEEWDEYEGLYLYSTMDYLGQNPSDPDAPQIFDRISTWRSAYLKWGRSTLGFGVHLFKKF